jgi:hypothetical protein
MNSGDDPYQSWLEHRRNIEISSDFSREVMARISELESRDMATSKRDFLHGCLEWISLHPAVQAAIFVVGLLLGLARLLISSHIVLSF